VALFLVIVVAIILLAPSYYLSDSKLEEEKVKLGNLEQSLSYRESRNTEEELKKTADLIEVLSGYLQKENLEKDFGASLSASPRGVSIYSLSWRSVSQAESEITISGLAQTREALLTFSKNLEKVESFSKVDLPISNLAKETEVMFVVTVTASISE
jgi:Tfp pilus assembly protein PilN